MTRDRRTDLLISLALLAAVVAVYWPVARFGFVAFDDDEYIYRNPALSAGLSPAGLRWAFTTCHAANYHPLVWVSFLLDRSVWHLRPGPMHVENVALHAASAVLLFTWLKRMTGARWPAAFVAGVFALHPAHVESVAWVTERKDTLSVFFLLLSGHCYVRYAEGRRRWYAGLLAAYAASLLAKSTGVSWPAVLLLLDGWPLRRTRGVLPPQYVAVKWWGAVREKLPLFALALAGATMTSVAQHAGGAMAKVEAVPVTARIGNGVVAYVRYLGETAWPNDLAAFYRLVWPLPTSTVVGSAIAMLGLTALAVGVGRRRPHIAVGWLWYVGTMVPMLGLVQVGSQSMADRYLYLPMVGLTIVVAWCAADVPGRSVPALLAAALVAMGVAARRQVWTWADTTSLKGRMMFVDGGEPARQEWLGTQAVAAGDVAGAELHLSEAMRLDPANDAAPYNLGNLRLRVEGRPEAAIECYRRAAANRPGAVAVETNWGVALVQLGRNAEAIEHLRRAERGDPGAYGPHFFLGLLLMATDRRAAAAEFAAALRADPTSASARARLAEANR